MSSKTANLPNELFRADIEDTANDYYFYLQSLDGLTDYKIKKNALLPNKKIYKALVSQSAPITITAGVLPIGVIWTITNYIAGDDFSNMELISGVMNTTGAVIRSNPSLAPTNYSHGSTLHYDGSPYIVSTNSNNDFAPLEDTVGTLSVPVTLSFDVTGGYFVNCVGAFAGGESKLHFPTTFPKNETGTVYGHLVSDDQLAIDTYSDLHTTRANGVLSYYPIHFEIYP